LKRRKEKDLDKGRETSIQKNSKIRKSKRREISLDKGVKIGKKKD
jgi:hypothetical protein